MVLVPVRDIGIRPDMMASEIIEEMKESGGFQSVNLARAEEILVEMIQDADATRFLSFTANVVATGLRGILRDLIRNGLFDVVITTSGSLDHDLNRCWGDYYHGSFLMDDTELRDKGTGRLGNVLVPMKHFNTLEERTQLALEELHSTKKTWGVRELLVELGRRLGDDTSFLRAAADSGTAVYVPGVVDGAVGNQLWLFRERRPDFTVDILADQRELSDLIFKAKRTGALVLGGGISKHHTIAWNMFKGGLDYAVYITTAMEYDGSLSGARTREAISWSKLDREASHVTVMSEVSLILPLLASSVLRKIAGRT